MLIILQLMDGLSALKIANGNNAQNIAPNAENVRSCILKLSGSVKPSSDLLSAIRIAENPTMPRATSAITCKALKSNSIYANYRILVGMEGVEPPRLAALGSKPSVSTSFTTSPKQKKNYIIKTNKYYREFNLMI